MNLNLERLGVDKKYESLLWLWQVLQHLETFQPRDGVKSEAEES